MLTRDFLCSQRNQTQQGSETETVEERQGEGEEEGGGGEQEREMNGVEVSQMVGLKRER